jgi:hypothetical protein
LLGTIWPCPIEEARPAICLNMIARSEAHIIRETLDTVAPFIGSWVIVDAGSDDGAQDLIRRPMADFGIPSTYPDALTPSPQRRTAGPRDTEVVVSLVAGPDPARIERTLNSFLNCCTDVSRVGRFLGGRGRPGRYGSREAA